MVRILFYVIFFIIQPVFVFSQIEETTPELIFTVDYIYFPKIGHEKIGVTAMEYHGGYLYIALFDKILKTDLQGNIINVLHPNSDIRISDIAFCKDELVIWSPSTFENLIFLRILLNSRQLF